MSTLPANNDNQRALVVCMSRECALWLGAKLVPFDHNGQPLPLVPPRPTILVHGHDWAGDMRDGATWMYWDVVPEQPLTDKGDLTDDN